MAGLWEVDRRKREQAELKGNALDLSISVSKANDLFEIRQHPGNRTIFLWLKELQVCVIMWMGWRRKEVVVWRERSW